MDCNNSDYYMSRRQNCYKRSADPYDFEEDAMGSATRNLDPFKIKEERDDLKAPNSVKSQSDPLSPSKRHANLYTHEGLAPKASDLDDIFGSIDDVSRLYSIIL